MFLNADNLLRKIGDAGEVIKEEVNTTTMTLGERTAYCLQRTLIGLIIVFGVLAIIMLVLYVSKFIFSRETKPKKTEEKTEAVTNQAEEPAQNDERGRGKRRHVPRGFLQAQSQNETVESE